MVVTGRDRAEEFAQKHAMARKATDSMLKALEGCQAKNPVDLKNTFRSADYYEKHAILDMGKGDRVIVKIHYEKKIAAIKMILTHDEYMKGDWKKKLT